MNKVILTGYLTKDPNLTYYGSDNKALAKFTIAVNRSYKGKDGKSEADFINCSCYGKRAEAMEKHFSKGKAITVEGEWRTGSYEKDGNRVYTNECVVSNWEFPLGGKNESGSSTPAQSDPKQEQSQDDDFVKVDGVADDIPFFDM